MGEGGQNSEQRARRWSLDTTLDSTLDRILDAGLESRTQETACDAETLDTGQDGTGWAREQSRNDLVPRDSAAAEKDQAWGNIPI